MAIETRLGALAVQVVHASPVPTTLIGARLVGLKDANIVETLGHLAAAKNEHLRSNKDGAVAFTLAPGLGRACRPLGPALCRQVQAPHVAETVGAPRGSAATRHDDAVAVAEGAVGLAWGRSGPADRQLSPASSRDVVRIHVIHVRAISNKAAEQNQVPIDQCQRVTLPC